jgi:hypothetical protein
MQIDGEGIENLLVNMVFQFFFLKDTFSCLFTLE